MTVNNVFEDKDDLENIYHLIVSFESFSLFDLEYLLHDYVLQMLISHF